jgi:hypothetical protein
MADLTSPTRPDFLKKRLETRVDVSPVDRVNPYKQRAVSAVGDFVTEGTER